MSYAVKYSWHEPTGAFSKRSDAQALAKHMREANRQAGLKGPVKVVKVKGNPARKSKKASVIERAYKSAVGKLKNPPRVHRKKTMTIRNAASVTIKQLPDGRALVRVKR